MVQILRLQPVIDAELVKLAQDQDPSDHGLMDWVSHVVHLSDSVDKDALKPCAVVLQ